MTEEEFIEKYAKKLREIPLESAVTQEMHDALVIAMREEKAELVKELATLPVLQTLFRIIEQQQAHIAKLEQEASDARWDREETRDLRERERLRGPEHMGG